LEDDMIVKGTAWISDNGDEYWAENEACTVEVQRTDENELRLGVQLHESESDDVTVYLTLGEASRLAHMLGIYVLAHEAAAHEATKYGAASG
jgi:hypothetical protein